MADVNGVNYDKAFVAQPREQVSATEYGAKIRRVRDRYEASSLASGDDIRVGRISKGSQIVGGSIYHDALGASTTLQVAIRGLKSGTEILLGSTGSTSSAGRIDLLSVILASGGNFVTPEATEESDIIVKMGGAAGTGTIAADLLVAET